MPTDTPLPFDIAQAHRHFSAAFFNNTWTLISKPDRTANDDEAMICSSTASLWHWMQRPDCTQQNLSIGHWQLSRVFSIAGQGENAMRHGRRSLVLAADGPPFYLGYAHEAIARAAAVLGDDDTRRAHLDLAAAYANAVVEESERALLDADLRTLTVVFVHSKT